MSYTGHVTRPAKGIGGIPYTVSSAMLPGWWKGPQSPTPSCVTSHVKGDWGNSLRRAELQGWFKWFKGFGGIPYTGMCDQAG